MDLEKSRARIAEALRTLEKALASLVAAISHEPVWVSLEAKDDARSDIRRACEAYTAIDYGMEDEANRSVICLGALGVAAAIVSLVGNVNTAKAELKKICTELSGIRIRVPVKGSDGPTKAIPATRVILRSIQRSDLNLLAAYRRIPVLDALPSTITYTVARTRAVYRMPLEELHVLLSTREHPRAGFDRAKLLSVGRRETHLALVRERYTNIRANVLYTRLDPRGRGRAQFAAELPLIFQLRARDEAPIPKYPIAEMAPSSALRLRQRSLEPEPYFETLPVYRYINRQRE